MTANIPSTAERILQRLCQEFDNADHAIAQLLVYLQEGLRIPYLSRYRRDELGGMSEERLYEIHKRLEELSISEELKSVVFDKLQTAGLLTDQLAERLLATHELAAIEDIHRGTMQKRSKDADVAIERGLEPLARKIAARELEPGQAPLDLAATFVDPDKGVEDAQAALVGAKAILLDEISDGQRMRNLLRNSRIRTSPAKPGRAVAKEFQSVTGIDKPAKQVNWRTFLQMKKGAREGQLAIEFGLPEEKAHQILAEEFASDLTDSADPLRNFYDSLLRQAWHERLKEPCEKEVIRELKERADREAIRLFSKTYRGLLMAPASGRVRICGVLPAIRKATRAVVVDEQGAMVAHASLHPLRIEHKEEAKKRINELVAEHAVSIIALGAGPGCRELESFLMEVFTELETRPQILVVDEAGTLHLARREVSRHDMSTRKAALLARRLQNPLTEWARLEPDQAPLGYGQEEVHQGVLRRSLETVRESCLHAVGVDLETVPEETLALICGLDRTSAAAIVKRRGHETGITTLQTLADENLLTPESFLQAAPFLRLPRGTEKLDNTRIEPRHYPLVEEMAASLGLSKTQLVETPGQVERLKLHAFEREGVSKGLLKFIVREIENPSADPRTKFEMIEFGKDHRTLQSLSMGQELRGRVMRLAEFGAFVDVGVDTGGLLHISQMSERFVGDPTRFLSEGQVIDVRVLEVDQKNGRLSLTMLSGDIQKVQRTLGDYAEGKRKPGAVVVPRGGEREAGHGGRGGQGRGREGAGRGGPRGGQRRPQQQQQQQGSAPQVRGDQSRGQTGGGRGGPGRGGPGRGGPGHGGPRRPGERRDGRRDSREGGRRERGDRGPRIGSQGWTTESEDIRKAEVEARGNKGELKSFAALASMFGGDEKPAAQPPKAQEQPKVEAPQVEQPKVEEPRVEPPKVEPPKPEVSEAPKEEKKPETPTADSVAEAPKDEKGKDSDFGSEFV